MFLNQRIICFLLLFSFFFLHSASASSFPKSNFIMPVEWKSWNSANFQPVLTDTVSHNSFHLAKVSITFDDGHISIYNKALPVLAPRGMPGIFYAKTDNLGSGADWLINWAQAKELQDKWGWEIGSHTFSHPYLTQISKQQLRRELLRSKVDLEKNGLRAYSFASPYGAYNSETLSEISKIYSSHRAAWGGRNIFPYNNYELKAREVTHETSPETVRQWLEEASLNGEWLILLFHSIAEEEAENYSYNFDDFVRVADYIQQSGLPVVKITSSLEHWGRGENILSNSGFESASGGDALAWARNTDQGLAVNEQVLGSYDNPLKSFAFTGGQEQKMISTEIKNIIGGQSYILKSWQNLSDYQSGGFYYWIDEFDGSGYYLQGQMLGSASANFLGTKYLIYQPHQSASSARLYIFTSAGASVNVYLDNVELKINTF